MLMRGRKICCPFLQLQSRFHASFCSSAIEGRAGFLFTRERAVLVMANGESILGLFLRVASSASAAARLVSQMFLNLASHFLKVSMVCWQRADESYMRAMLFLAFLSATLPSKVTFLS
jgi:hypothetical protein